MTFRKFLNNKVFYVSAFVLLAVMASGLYIMSDTTTVSAQKGDLTSRTNSKGKVARADQLAVALNFGSTSEYTVFGAKGVRGDGAGVTGKSGSGLDEASLGEDGSGMKARSGVTKALSMINQLPCQDMDGELTGGTFKPGVYCAPSAALAGQMVLDAGGDATGSFVFRISGAMKSAESFQMSLENGAKPGNVFFIADTASLGAYGSIVGTVIGRGSVEVGAGTKINGRAFSKEGEVVLGDASNVALAEGFIEICKRALHDGIASTGDTGFDQGTDDSDLNNNQHSLRYKIFRFQVNGGTIYEVPTGSCSQPIQVPEGNNVITELLDGYYTNRDRAAHGGTWFNRFRLVAVTEAGYLEGSGAPADTGITATNLTTRTVSVNVAHAPSTSPTILTFHNTFAIMAVIEICKYSANLLTPLTGNPPTRFTGGTPSVPIEDATTEGFFDFTVNTNVGALYTIPVGFCTGPIQVLAADRPEAPPGDAVVIVSELTEFGFTLERMTTTPADRQVNTGFNVKIKDSDACSIITNGNFPTTADGVCTLTNIGGGAQSGRVIEATTPANQTIFNFFNRNNPGIIKICKIAGRGVEIGTRFDFEVRGRQATSATVILPGTDVVRTVRLAAGPASQGGFCKIVTDPVEDLPEGGSATRFIVGTLAFVQETAVVDDVTGVESGGFGDRPGEGFILSALTDGPDTMPDSEVRVSRITVNGSTAAANFPSPSTVQTRTLGNPGTAAGNTNPNLWSDESATATTNRRSAIFRVNRGETVVTYVNRLFRPTKFKICKVAGTGVPVGTIFNFTFAIGTEDGLVPGQTNEPIGVTAVNIPAGDPGPSGQGNCVTVSGPYESEEPSAIPFRGTFDVGSTIVVTEGGAGGTVTITSPTATGTNFSQSGTRAGTLVFEHIGGFNEMIFVNSAGAPVSTGYTLSGRVMTPDGGGLRNAQVILTKADGTRMTVPTSSMGYYSFDGLAGETYTVGVSSRRYRFTSRQINLDSSLANADFRGIE